MSESGTKQEMESLDNEGNEINKWFQELSSDERGLKFVYASTKALMLMYRKESLNDILSLKEKNITPIKEKKGLFKRLLKKYSR